jgi:hypothetical protein
MSFVIHLKNIVMAIVNVSSSDILGRVEEMRQCKINLKVITERFILVQAIQRVTTPHSVLLYYYVAFR